MSDKGTKGDAKKGGPPPKRTDKEMAAFKAAVADGLSHPDPNGLEKVAAAKRHGWSKSVTAHFASLGADPRENVAGAEADGTDDDSGDGGDAE